MKWYEWCSTHQSITLDYGITPDAAISDVLWITVSPWNIKPKLLKTLCKETQRVANSSVSVPRWQAWPAVPWCWIIWFAQIIFGQTMVYSCWATGQNNWMTSWQGEPVQALVKLFNVSMRHLMCLLKSIHCSDGLFDAFHSNSGVVTYLFY